MSTHNIGFYEDLTKIIFELSSNIISNTHLISSSALLYLIRPIFISPICLNTEILGVSET